MTDVDRQNPFEFTDMKRELLVKALVEKLEKKDADDGGKLVGENFDRFYEIQVSVTGKGAEENPEYHVEKFEEAGLSEQLRANILFDQPLPIQKYAIPYILKGLDVIGHSITGSGKTAAYVLPIIEMLSNNENGPVDSDHADTSPILAVYPRALVLVPTRELAIQIAGEFKRFAAGIQFNTKLLYGGEYTVNQQLAELRDGNCDVLVATLGRLKNCMIRGHISMAKVKYLILDEADKMLDFRDFGRKIKFIVEENGMPKKDERQTLMFSATFPDDIHEKMIDKYMNDDYVFITVGKVNSANPDITQEVIKTTAGEKFALLLQILNDRLKEVQIKVLIFVNHSGSEITGGSLGSR